MTILPRSLYGRLVLLLVVVLVTAQLLGLALHMHDRSELLREASGMQSARRIADIVRLLDSLQPAERRRIEAVLGTPQMRVEVDTPQGPLPLQSAEQRARALLFAAFLQRSVGDAREFTVAMTNVRPSDAPPPMGPGAGGPDPDPDPDPDTDPNMAPGLRCTCA